MFSFFKFRFINMIETKHCFRTDKASFSTQESNAFIRQKQDFTLTCYFYLYKGPYTLHAR